MFLDDHQDVHSSALRRDENYLGRKQKETKLERNKTKKKGKRVWYGEKDRAIGVK